MNFSGINNRFSKLWSQKGDLKVMELGSNYFQFIFTSNEEKARALQKRPWFFDNQVVALQPWKPNLGDDPAFKKAQIWVQVRGLPTYWSSKEVGWKVGKIFSHCLNVIYPEHGSKEGKLLKLLVEIELDKPLLRRTKINWERKFCG